MTPLVLLLFTGVVGLSAVAVAGSRAARPEWTPLVLACGGAACLALVFLAGLVLGHWLGATQHLRPAFPY